MSHLQPNHNTYIHVYLFTCLPVVSLCTVPLYPPTEVKCHNISSTALAVQWQVPLMHGMGRSFIRGYEVFYKLRSTIPPKWDTLIACNSSFNITITDLEKYKEYEIMVAAFNGGGPGNYSVVVGCFTDEDGE